MKFKLLLLPVLISLLSACGDDDKKKVNPVSQKSKTTTSAANGELLAPGAKGDISKQGGATRLRAERTEALKASLSNRQVKNVILFIGDGTSESEITAARNYAEGASGYFKGLDAFPFTGAYTTYALEKGKNSIEYVTDSAASATAWSSGVKTYNNALGIDTYGTVHPSILALAKQAGFATGNVTTTELQDATPAAQISSISARFCYGPVATKKHCNESSLDNPQGNNLGSITEQLLNARADVTLGGGAKSFNEVAVGGKYLGKTLYQQAQDQSYKIVRNLDEMKAVSAANQTQPVLGLFAEGNLPVSWTGPAATVGGQRAAAVECNKNNPKRPASIPTLKDMTSKAIELLQVNKKGFFLQVESGSIDKENHMANACGQIGETVALDEAIQVAFEFAKNNPDTLIIVTGDHAHTSQIIPSSPIIPKSIIGQLVPEGTASPGKTVTLKTKDNAVMTLNYGTSTGPFQEHTGAQVRTAAYGPRAANISGLLDQTDLFFIMRDALGIKANAPK